MLLTIAAVADIHSPRFLSLFKKALDNVRLSDCNVFILAGDLVEKGKVFHAKALFDLLYKKFKGPIIATFGNEDYEEIEPKLREYFPEVIWLNDQYYDLTINDFKIRIIGSRGVLEKPTPWQAKNIPNIKNIYYRRIKLLEAMLRSSPNPTILVTHYAPTFKTLKGEPPSIWVYMGSRKMENIISKYRPLAVIHGHAHKSVIEKVIINDVPIFNVSLPAFGKIFRISVSIKETLLAYL